MNMQEAKAITAYKQGLRAKILTTAINDFRQRGIRAVKMDDVAAELGISKRTLYEIFDKKEDLLYESLKHYYVERRERIYVKVQHCANVMEIILAVYRIKVEEFQQTNPNFFVDLVKYPQVLRFLNQENQTNRSKFLLFIERGINEGFFRSDVNYELTTRLFDVLGNYVMENQLYRQYTIEEIFKNLIFVTLRGMCTARGAATLENILK
jgi:AcrR family transcriptional regulator